MMFATFCSSAFAAPALVDDARLRPDVLISRPYTVLTAMPPLELVDVAAGGEPAFAGAVSVPAVIPRRDSASNPLGPGMRLAVTPGFTAIFSVSPPLA